MAGGVMTKKECLEFRTLRKSFRQGSLRGGTNSVFAALYIQERKS